MSRVVYEMSMSVDGFVTAADVTAEAGLGRGGERLHEWGMPGADPRGGPLVEQRFQSTGAIICGRRTYDLSLQWWGPDGPTGEARIPVFVPTHRESPAPPAGGVYTFVTDGIDSVVRQAKAAAGDRDVAVSGAEVLRHLIQAGHLDELWVHVVPVLFGDGTRFYEQIGGEHVELELVEAIPTADATHLHYRARTK